MWTWRTICERMRLCSSEAVVTWILLAIKLLVALVQLVLLIELSKQVTQADSRLASLMGFVLQVRDTQRDQLLHDCG